MPLVILTSLLLIALTTLIHYEVISRLGTRMPTLKLTARSKLMIVIFATGFAHAVQVVLYGVAMYLLVNFAGAGRLEGPDGPALASCIYFSAESYTSLGFGDIKPTGPIRMITGIEALNGLVLIGWTACYLFMEAERFRVAERESA